jgi:small ligand-binding sensory domain FIST
MRRFGAGLATSGSAVPDGETAAARAAEALGGHRPDLAVVFASGAYGPDAALVGPAVAAATDARVLIGAVGVSGVIGSGREVDEEPAVAVWLAELQGLDMRPAAWQEGDIPSTPSGAVAVVLADPYTCAADELAAALGSNGTGCVGGLTGGAGAGQARLFLGDNVVTTGAVGVVLPPGACVPLVSQGCRPIGPELTITAASGNLVVELAGRPALEKLEEVFRHLEPHDRELAGRGLLAGLVVDENQPEYGVGDYLVRVILAADQATSAVAIGDVPRIGQTFRFHVRDTESASSELTAVLDSGPERLGGVPGGALLFSCNGRGRHMFGEPDHDAAALSKRLGVPAVGLFCQGEIGPVGGENHLHGFTATIALFAR